MNQLAYCYDGTFDGFLTCVFTAYNRKDEPAIIFPETERQATLFDVLTVETSAEHAKRVAAGLRKRSAELLRFVQTAFLTCLPEKERHLLAFVRLAFEAGAGALTMFADDRFAVLNNAVVHIGKEADHYKGFVRFVEINGVLTSTIEPKNYVLPLVASHFANRFQRERFVIFDQTHSMAAMSEFGKVKYAYADAIEFDPPSEREQEFQRMWKLFYDTIAISERFNPRCRMSMMPKRYWSRMSELAGQN